MSGIERVATFNFSGSSEQGDLLAEYDNLPIEYSIPFDWGALQVTKAAQEAYDLVPLIEGVQKGELSPEDYGKKVEVKIIGPSEIPEDSPVRDAAPGYFLYGNTGGKNIKIHFAFNKDRDGNIEHVADWVRTAIAEDMGLEEDEDPFSYDDEEETEFTETIGHQLPQMMMHSMCTVIQHSVQQMMADKLRRGAEKEIAHAQSSRSMLALMGAATLNVVLGPEAVTELLAGGLIGATILRNNRILRQYAELATTKEEFILIQATEVANDVYNSLHRTYCTTHFDQALEGQFPEDEDQQE